jgi:hypothetical protein
MTVKYHFNCYCNAVPVPASAKERMFTFSFIPGRESSVGIRNRYGLDGPGIDSWWRPGVLSASRPTARPKRLLYNGHRVILWGNVTETWH